eukprot:TRINITY_DN5985_c0_g1_i1.p1 TRINITY_DN5985_c0_g1~~TRINITY_DN5985_c0_g1_i1.p1  ORF type:complete len:308 (+),score=90.20 TRINITY_DN5985_c0_g1_i1:35-958(+)
MMSRLDQLTRAAKYIREADAILVCTGAGMGVASGLGTFRGIAAGIWPPLEKRGLEFPQLSNPDWFDKSTDPSTPTLQNAGFGYAFWQFRYNAYTQGPTSVPHEGYNIICNWINQKKSNNEELKGGFSCTSNIDGMWRRSGIDKDQIFEVHGSVEFMQCVKRCEDIYETNPEDWKMQINEENDCALPPFPQCPGCKKLARPNVMMFGDWGFKSERIEAQQDRYEEWINKFYNSDLKLTILEIGAGIAVPTIRKISENTCSSIGDNCSLLRFNPEYPNFPSNFDSKNSMSFTDPSVDLLREIDEILNKK